MPGNETCLSKKMGSELRSKLTIRDHLESQARKKDAVPILLVYKSGQMKGGFVQHYAPLKALENSDRMERPGETIVAEGGRKLRDFSRNITEKDYFPTAQRCSKKGKGKKGGEGQGFMGTLPESEPEQALRDFLRD